ncbi:unnamed protein product [Ceratitis capitata]|uniref:(Mediterranean fruit fly) hypothetical protein n=1 Tax=Ceratitis capitata TaxID=7213 RepID=A0A811UAE9_CERCA|nr:unnamed protein product [Ceratitis capitata]
MISNKEVLLSEELQRITLSITVETTMGKKMQEGDQVSEELVKAYVICIEKLPMECFLSYVKLGKWYAQFSKTAKEYVYRFIEELLYQKLSQTVSRKSCTYTMECSENSETNVEDSFGGNAFNERAPNIFVDQAINLYREGKMSHHSLIGESNTIVSAAFETSANGLLSSLLMLAIHPVVQERLYDEIHLPYLDMVVNETLRLLPPIPIIGRQVVKNTTLSNGLVLPRGLEILISIFDLHRRTDIWGANAHEFNPDNFLPGNLEEKHTHAYIPFSKGIRNCIGWKYALMAIKILLAGLVRNFSFSTSVKLEDLKFTNSLSLKYTNEPAFTIKHRLK